LAQLHEQLAATVDAWRNQGYPCDAYPTIVEIKAERDRTDGIHGENGRKAMAVRKWENLDPDRLRYAMIFTDSATRAADELLARRRFIEEFET